MTQLGNDRNQLNFKPEQTSGDTIKQFESVLDKLNSINSHLARLLEIR